VAKNCRTPSQVQKFLKRRIIPRKKREKLSKRLIKVKIEEGPLFRAALLQQPSGTAWLSAFSDEFRSTTTLTTLFLSLKKKDVGSIGRSRMKDSMVVSHFRTLKHLAMSIYDPFIDETGRVTGLVSPILTIPRRVGDIARETLSFDGANR